MEFRAVLSKMPIVEKSPVEYLLLTENDFLKLNPLIGREVALHFLHEKYCQSCGNKYNDLYRMGFCKNCFFTKPEAGESIIRPELSRAHEGVEDRDLTFEKSYQLQPHVVYLANSGGVKVGVTRAQQKINRWVDQGAAEAVVFAETSNRYEAGLIEVAMKEHISDKTVWQRMLKGEYEAVDLLSEKERLTAMLPQDLTHFASADSEIYKMEYPVEKYPSKVKSVNLDKQEKVEAVLQGIRGQYLIFEGGLALNIRSHSGYTISLSF